MQLVSCTHVYVVVNIYYLLFTDTQQDTLINFYYTKKITQHTDLLLN